jgi:hypothetical protein
MVSELTDGACVEASPPSADASGVEALGVSCGAYDPRSLQATSNADSAHEEANPETQARWPEARLGSPALLQVKVMFNKKVKQRHGAVKKQNFRESFAE